MSLIVYITLVVLIIIYLLMQYTQMKLHASMDAWNTIKGSCITLITEGLGYNWTQLCMRPWGTSCTTHTHDKGD